MSSMVPKATAQTIKHPALEQLRHGLTEQGSRAIPQGAVTVFEQPDGVLAELVLAPAYPGMFTCPLGEPFRIFGDPQ